MVLFRRQPKSIHCRFGILSSFQPHFFLSLSSTLSLSLFAFSSSSSSTPSILLSTLHSLLPASFSIVLGLPRAVHHHLISTSLSLTSLHLLFRTCVSGGSRPPDNSSTPKDIQKSYPRIPSPAPPVSQSSTPELLVYLHNQAWLAFNLSQRTILTVNCILQLSYPSPDTRY